MHFSRVVLALAVVVLSVDATLIIGATGTVGAGAAVAGVALAGVAGLALGAGLVGAIALARRGKRSVLAQQQEDMVFGMVAAADAYGCALKLVCQVEAKPAADLTAEDELILSLFGSSPNSVEAEAVSSPREAYFYAAALGNEQGAAACDAVFHTCEATYDQMMAYVRALRA